MPATLCETAPYFRSSRPMNVTEFFVNITSDRPSELFRFYRDVVALPAAPEYGPAVRAAGAIITFNSHSEVRGGSKEPQRHFTSLKVEDISAEQARIEAQGVSFIRRKGREHWGGIISTFLDPDGNYVQLLQYDESTVA
ncbi:MAG: VOC family protein [Dehalococcoidia bacterium]